MGKNKLFCFLIFFFLCANKLGAQSCFNFYSANDTMISCLDTCFTLKARIPDLKSTEDYSVISIPYNPYPYVTAAPPWVHPCVPIFNLDDGFGPTTTLPFTFCFYGNFYNKYVLGTNGVITFDTLNALLGNNWDLGSPIPFIGSGTHDSICSGQVGINGVLYPKLAIMGAYQDLTPKINDPFYKIETRVIGLSPCRKLIVSYYNVDLYNCPGSRPTFEIVLHEGTGYIDVYIENQPACDGAIVGIQRDGLPGPHFASPPGRNLFSGTVNNEGWRFVPDGPTSHFDSVFLYRNNIRIATGSVTNIGNGELEASFPNICQPTDSTSYVVKAFYRQCDNLANILEGTDTFTVYKTLKPILPNITAVKCFGTNTGSVSVISPLGVNIEYSINNGLTWQASNTFNNLLAGIYTLKARVIRSTCDGDTVINITEPTKLTGTATTSGASCQNNDGTITVSPLGGTPVYKYSINGGLTFVSSNIFSGLSVGSYSVIIKDLNSCMATVNANVILINDTMRLELGPDSTVCSGVPVMFLPQTNDSVNIFKWIPATGLNYDTVKNPIAKPLDTTKYFLTAKWGACQRTDSVTINIKRTEIAFGISPTYKLVYIIYIACFKTVHCFAYGFKIEVGMFHYGCGEVV